MKIALVAAAALTSVVSAQTIQPQPDPFGAVIAAGKPVSHTGNVVIAGNHITLTKVAGLPDPSVLFDYGRDVGGVPQFHLTQVSGKPALRAVYSESRPYLLPDGDGASAFDNPPNDPGRADIYFPTRAGTIVNPQLQGGERFEQIALTQPGSVTIDAVGIKSLTADPQSSGHFAASDPRLTQIWTIGARSLQICEVPLHSVLPLLTSDAEGFHTATTSKTMYQFGAKWHNYTAAVDVRIDANQASFIVGGSVAISIAADGNRLGAANRITATQAGFFQAVTLGSADLATPLQPGSWHRIQVSLQGARIAVQLDGKTLFTTQAASNVMGSTPGTGSVGFMAPSGGSATFRNLDVQGADHQVLYQSALNDATSFHDFGAGANELPVILDGAKRDRALWLGDLDRSAAVVYYTSDENQYVAGSLQLLGSFTTPEGEIASAVPPSIPPGLGDSAHLPEAVNFYSLPYSIYYLTVLGQYVLYSGDTSLAAKEWPVVEHELAYLAAHSGPDGLVRTVAADGMDWSLNTNTGAVASYNLLYAQGLKSAAMLARTLGKPDADRYQALADQVIATINRDLVDPGMGFYEPSAQRAKAVAQDANVMAVLSGAITGARAAKLLDDADKVLMTPHGPAANSDGKGLTALISPFMAAYEAEARFQLGDTTKALDLIRKVWSSALPGSPFYSGAAQEALAMDGVSPQMPSRTLSHAWSAGATAVLSAYVLGVRPTAPGYASFVIAPQTGDLTWARGDVPSPQGPISVSWQRKGDRFSIQASFKGTGNASFQLPGNALISGAAPSSPLPGGSIAIGPLPAGTYRFVTLGPLSAGSSQ